MKSGPTLRPTARKLPTGSRPGSWTCSKGSRCSPVLGHRREDLTPDPTVRFILVARFLVVYREREDVVEVARVLGAAMDITGLF